MTDETPRGAIAHATATITRRYGAPPERVFAARADAEARREWGGPSDDVTLTHERADFRVGGEDVSVCMVGGEPVARVHTRYLDLVPDRRVVLAEVIEAEDRREGVCLVGAEMLPDGAGTRLVLTLQTLAFDGSDFAAGVEEGWGHALDRLGRLAEAVAAS